MKLHLPLRIWVALGVGVLYLVLFGVLVQTLHAQGRTLADFAIGTSGDTWEYATLGQSLASSGTFTLGQRPEYFRTPGEPMLEAFVLLVTHSFVAILLVHILLVVASVWLIAWLGEKFFVPWVGIVAGILYALDPTTILTTFATLSDILFVFVVLAMVYVVAHQQRLYIDAAVLGALGGYLVLTKTLGLFVLPIFVLWFAYERSSFAKGYGETQSGKDIWKGFAVCILAVVVVLSPWVARNYIETGHLSLSTVGAYNFLFYNVTEYQVAHGEETRESAYTKMVERVGATDLTLLRDFTYADRIGALAKEFLLSHTLSYAIFHVEKTVPYYIGSSIEQSMRNLHTLGVLTGPQLPVENISSDILHGHSTQALGALIQNPFGLVERLGWVVLLMLDLVVLVLARGKQRIFVVVCALLALAFGLLTGPVSFPRYRLPTEPFMFLAALQGVALLVPYVTHSVREFLKYVASSLGALVVDVGLLVVLVHFGVHYLVAAALSFSVGIAITYFLSIGWVFTHRSYGHDRQKEFIIFLAIGIAGLVLNELALWVFTDELGLHYLLSKVVSVVIVFSWNFIARKYMLFRA